MAAALGALVAARCPQLLAHPRFWAEEGQVYFAQAWNHGFWSALLTPQLGYFAIVPNAAAALASVAPLPLAPAVTTLTALVVQVLVGLVASTSASALLDSRSRRLAVAFGIQLVAPAEVWLTTIAAQFWLCIGAFLVLVEDASPLSRSGTWLRRTLLGVAALTGVPTSFLLPLFVLRARRSKAREPWIQLGIVASGACIQLVAAASALAANESSVTTRFARNDFSASLLLRHLFVEPLLGVEIFGSRPEPVMSAAGIVLAAAVACVIVAALLAPSTRTAGLSFLSVAVLSNVFAIEMVSAARYAFAPTAMLLVLLAGQFRRGGPRWTQAIMGSLLLTALVSNLHSYRGRVFISPSWPRWTDQVAAWREGRTERLLIWPQFRVARWSVELRRRP